MSWTWIPGLCPPTESRSNLKSESPGCQCGGQRLGRLWHWHVQVLTSNKGICQWRTSTVVIRLSSRGPGPPELLAKWAQAPTVTVTVAQTGLRLVNTAVTRTLTWWLATGNSNSNLIIQLPRDRDTARQAW